MDNGTTYIKQKKTLQSLKFILAGQIKLDKTLLNKRYPKKGVKIEFT